MTSSDILKPTYARNMKILGHSDQGSGRADGVQIMVHRGYAYIGHISPRASASSMCAIRVSPNR